MLALFSIYTVLTERAEDLDLLVSDESKDEGANLHQHGDVGPENEQNDVVDCQFVVVGFHKPVLAPIFREAQCVENGSKSQREGEKNIGRPELAAKNFVKIFVVALEAGKHPASDTEENESQ